MPDAGKWLARDRGAFERVAILREARTVEQATAELQDFLSETEQRWMKDLFLRLGAPVRCDCGYCSDVSLGNDVQNGR